jgi:hypothetical protein
VADLSLVTDTSIQKRAIENLAKADEGLARAVGTRAGEVDSKEMKRSEALRPPGLVSIFYFGRKGPCVVLKTQDYV